MDGFKWRTNIIDQLQKRNKTETASFQDLISLHSRLFDNVNTLKTENLQLALRNERIKAAGIESIQTYSGPGASNERIQVLEQRLLAQQEELTSLHRRKGENAQQIITLNAMLHEADKKLAHKDITISENVAVIASLRAEIQLYETNMAELHALNQVLRDEHQALQIAFASLEDKLRNIQDENRALVERLIKYKAKDAEKMNEENENFVKRKGEKMRKELEEAAREGGRSSSSGSQEERILDSMPFYTAILPTKVALQFDAHDGEVNAVKWSPTDRIVATGGADRKVKLWDVSKMGVCECKGALVGSNAGVMSVDFDSSGGYILGASNDFASRVWTVADQRLRLTADFDQWYPGNKDRFENKFPILKKKLTTLFETVSNKSQFVKELKDLLNKLLFPTEDCSIYYTKPSEGPGRAHGRLYDAVTNLKAKFRRNKVYQPRAKRNLDKTLTPGPQSKKSTNKRIVLLSEEDSALTREEEIDTAEVDECLEWLHCSADNLALCNEKWSKTRKRRQQRVISEETHTYLLEFPCLTRSWGYSLHSLTGHSGKVMAAKFLGELTKVITGSHDRTLKIWDLKSRMCTETKFAGSSCNDLVTSDGAGSTIISGHFDKRIRFWDIRTENSANHILLQGKITSLDLSRDSNYLLACVRDDTIQLIDLRMSSIVRSFNHESFKVGCDWSRAAFGPGGRLIAVGGADGTVFIWNTHSGKFEVGLKEHTSAVTAVSWHPQSGILATVDRSKRAIIWGDL